MLPDIQLDDERFEEILEKARKMIPGIHPEWTDFNYHDPGITLLELFAWMKEMQQFHMDQIGEKHKKKYLQLLGVTLRDRVPASALLTVRTSENGFLLSGSRFYADSICFETQEQEYLQKTEILEGIREADGKLQRFDLNPEKKRFRISVFGQTPQGGETFSLGMSAPLTCGVEQRLYVQIFDGYPVPRNPVGPEDSFLPLAKIQLEALTEEGYEPVSLQEDGTRALLFSGFLRFSVQKPMGEFQGKYWLRLRLLESGYETAPEMEAVSFHTFPVRQVQTLSKPADVLMTGGQFSLDFQLAAAGKVELYRKEKEGYRKWDVSVEKSLGKRDVTFRLLDAGEETGPVRAICYEPEFSRKREVGEGTGFPFQTYELEIPGLCREGLSVMVETASGTGLYREWIQVEDFDASGPEDLHYQVENGSLIFGDCFHGCAPEGRIFLGACHTSLGAGGNVKAGAIESRGQADSWIIRATNEEKALGGQEEETFSQCRLRLQERLHRTERAVTYEDYEALVGRTPGLRVRAVKAVPVTALKQPDGSMEEARVAIAVAPYSPAERSQPSPAYLENILRMLEPRRMIGTRVQILPSEYIGISVFAEVTANSYYEKVRQEIGRVLADFFEKQSWNFGLPVQHSEIYGLLDTLPGVVSVKTVTLDAKGKGVRRNRNGDLLLPVNGLVYLKDWECMISSAE